MNESDRREAEDDDLWDGVTEEGIEVAYQDWE